MAGCEKYSLSDDHGDANVANECCHDILSDQLRASRIIGSESKFIVACCSACTKGQRWWRAFGKRSVQKKVQASKTSAELNITNINSQESS